MLNTEKDYCPYCGELIELLIDLSQSNQEYIEDCSVCCRPIIVHVHMDEFTDALSIGLSTEDE
jgi:hypothetical protein